jgi:hypothetical protein
MSERGARTYEDRLAAIGAWSLDADRQNLDIVWEQPRGLATDLAPFLLRFHIESESGDYDPDGRMFELWEKYRRKHTAHIEEFEKRLVALYRGVTWDPQVHGYSAGLAEREILKLTKRATIVVGRTEFEGEKNDSLEVRFQLGWDEEHAYVLPFDYEAETFDTWQS